MGVRIIKIPKRRCGIRFQPYETVLAVGSRSDRNATMTQVPAKRPKGELLSGNKDPRHAPIGQYNIPVLAPQNGDDYL